MVGQSVVPKGAHTKGQVVDLELQAARPETTEAQVTPQPQSETDVAEAASSSTEAEQSAVANSQVGEDVSFALLGCGYTVPVTAAIAIGEIADKA